MSSAKFDSSAALAQLDKAVAADDITAGAAKNIRCWLTEDRYDRYAPEVAREIGEAKWKALDDAFWTIIPFGTGGRRGKMYPIGSNAINDRTIGESAQGLADYVKDVIQRGAEAAAADVSKASGDAGKTDSKGTPTPTSGRQPHEGATGIAPDHVPESQADIEEHLRCAIAYDTRHQSRHFAELCAEVMVAAGFKVYFLDGYRSTPELSFAVRYNKCACGIMVTASHNPPSDNAVKAYWSTGGQLLPPHDRGVIDRVMSTERIAHTPFAEAVKAGKVICCQEEVDKAYIQNVVAQAQAGPRELKIIYSPLHGVGASAVMPALAGDGFKDVELFGPQATADGDFPNVPGHVSNPELPVVFDSIIARGKQVGADLILASDPDCDRIGLAAPLTPGADDWRTMTGNQIAVLIADYLLERRKAAGSLSPEHYVIKTLVTTEMIRRIADSYGVRMCGELQVGFKYIGGLMDDLGPEKFIFGCEESHGYLVGSYARDKDAAVAAMLIAELAARAKAEGKTVHQKLDALSWQYGCHLERQISVTMPGSEGMARMTFVMKRLRETPPMEVSGMKVRRVRDYMSLQESVNGGPLQPFKGPQGDMVMIDLDRDGTYVAVRPSGTEPKVKLYMFTYEPAEQLHNLETTKQELSDLLDRLGKDLSSDVLG